VSKRLKALPTIGAAHGTDLLNVFGGGELADYIIRFVATLNPNAANAQGFEWPTYNPIKRQLLTFLDGNVSLAITSDSYRAAAMAFMTSLSLEHPL
jgi:acetylcholinesterase